MLNQIREKTQGIIASFILVLVTIPFALWGVNSYFSDTTNPNIAKANGTEISEDTYRRALDQIRSADPRRDNPMLRSLVLDQIITQTLLLENASDKGYRTSDARLAQLIRELPYFQREGRFDHDFYEALLRREGMSPLEFEKRLRREYVANQVQHGLSESVIVTDKDVDLLVRLLQQERRITYTLVTPERFLPMIDISAEAISSYYTANQDKYKTPEEVQVEYIRLSALDIVKEYQPREDELRAAYNDDPQRYMTPEKRRASHILIMLPVGAALEAEEKARARISEIEQKIGAGDDFGALAKKYSEDQQSAAKGGDLGEINRGLLPKELEAAIYSLKLNQVGAPIRTAFGYHLVRLTGLTPEKRVPFESIKKELTDTLRKRKGEERYFELAERFRNLVYEHPDSLTVAAKELNLVIEQSPWFSREGGAGIAAYQKVVEAAFHPEIITEGRNSDAIEVEGTTLIALRAKAHRPTSLRPLPEVKVGIERTLKEQRARERARELSEQGREELIQGSDLAMLVKQHGLTGAVSKSITREQTGGVDSRIVEAVFSAPKPVERPSYRTVDLGSQGFALVAILEVREGDPGKANAALKEKAKRQLVGRRGADYYEHYRAGLRREADVTIYSEKL